MLKIVSLSMVCLLTVVFFNGCSLTKEKDNNTNSSAVPVDASDLDLNDEDATEVATKDAYGEDMADINRYPDSIRTYYSDDSGEIEITYQTKATDQEIRDYYTKLLVDKGWKQIGKATDYIDFEKGDTNNPEVMTVYLTPYEKQGILEYELVYSPALTQEELDAENAIE